MQLQRVIEVYPFQCGRVRRQIIQIGVDHDIHRHVQGERTIPGTEFSGPQQVQRTDMENFMFDRGSHLLLRQRQENDRIEV